MTDTKPLNVREIGENGLQYRICWSEHIAAACRDRVDGSCANVKVRVA
jgi:hypothetical protein